MLALKVAAHVPELRPVREGGQDLLLVTVALHRVCTLAVRAVDVLLVLGGSIEVGITQ